MWNIAPVGLINNIILGVARIDKERKGLTIDGIFHSRIVGSFRDSAAVSVCENPYISGHRVTKGYASRGKTGKRWFLV
jgi:hypothetical protein